MKLLGILMICTAFPLLAFAEGPCARIIQKVRTREDLSRLIAQPPYDPMGAEFYEIFGNFLSQNKATASNLFELSEKAFLARLDFSKKHKTLFAEQMEPLDGRSQAIQKWKFRFEGTSDKNIWSYGIAGHWRADEIHKRMHSALQKDIFDLVFIEVPDNLPFPYSGPSRLLVRHWDFSQEFKNLELDAHIYELDADHILILHPADRDVPKIRAHLMNLWKWALNPHLTTKVRVEALADFEWTWFWLNPYGRAGAITGDVLSHLVQFEMEKQNLPIKIRKTFRAQDLEALAQRRSDYIKVRAAELLRSSYLR